MRIPPSVGWRRLSSWPWPAAAGALAALIPLRCGPCQPRGAGPARCARSSVYATTPSIAPLILGGRPRHRLGRAARSAAQHRPGAGGPLIAARPYRTLADLDAVRGVGPVLLAKPRRWSGSSGPGLARGHRGGRLRPPVRRPGAHPLTRCPPRWRSSAACCWASGPAGSGRTAAGADAELARRKGWLLAACLLLAALGFVRERQWAARLTRSPAGWARR